MAQINVSIAGRSYRMACDDGEERHLEQLAEQLDAKIGELRRDFGEIGDQRITVMAALTVADELSAAEQRLAALEARVAELEDRERTAEATLEEACGDFAGSLQKVADRIERIARDLDGPRRS